MEKSKKDIVLEWVEAFNNCNAKAAAQLYHKDAENLELAIGGIAIKGSSAIQEILETFFKAVPDNHTNVVHLFEDGDWAILEWSGTGTFYMDPHVEGRKFTLNGCGFFHIVDGKIRVQRGYWDRHTLFKQVGLPLD